MDNLFDNPFSVTRAADFTDEQIFQYWVDLSDGDGFLGLIQPRLEMPMLILGGKGSGKTHIMRYLSFPLQKMRHFGDLTAGVQKEGFIGIYMRCSGLNSTRFRGKQQSDDKWAGIFAYYMELWLSQMAVDICCEVISDSSDIATLNDLRGFGFFPILLVCFLMLVVFQEIFYGFRFAFIGVYREQSRCA